MTELQMLPHSLSPDGIQRWARIDQSGRYRYELGRRLPEHEVDRARVILFVMLNPSTADGLVDDPTIRRCLGFARRLDHGTVLVGNLFAWRATDPRRLRQIGVDVDGPQNVEHLESMARRAHLIIAAWGAPSVQTTAQVQMVHDVVRRSRSRLYCLGLTGAGHPRHPLYLPADAPLLHWPEGTPAPAEAAP